MRTSKRQAQPRPLVADAAERIGKIVEAAERAAESVIDDAEAQAERYLAEARETADRDAASRLSTQADLVDALLARAEDLRVEAERMVAALERARDELGGDGASLREVSGEVPEVRLARGSHLSAVADPEGERSSFAGARLLATQMAVSGSSREEIELRLRNGFEIEDPAAILDAILGPED